MYDIVKKSEIEDNLGTCMYVHYYLAENQRRAEAFEALLKILSLYLQIFGYYSAL